MVTPDLSHLSFLSLWCRASVLDGYCVIKTDHGKLPYQYSDWHFVFFWSAGEFFGFFYETKALVRRIIEYRHIVALRSYARFFNGKG